MFIKFIFFAPRPKRNAIVQERWQVTQNVSKAIKDFAVKHSVAHLESLRRFQHVLGDAISGSVYVGKHILSLVSHHDVSNGLQSEAPAVLEGD